MTTNSSFWVICPKCHYAHLVSSEVIQYFHGYSCYKCERNLKDVLDKVLSEYKEFTQNLSKLWENEKDNEKSKIYCKLLEIYNKKTLGEY